MNIETKASQRRIIVADYSGECYLEGWKAYKAGIDVSACPYDEGTSYAIHWQIGHVTAEAENNRETALIVSFYDRIKWVLIAACIAGILWAFMSG